MGTDASTGSYGKQACVVVSLLHLCLCFTDAKWILLTGKDLLWSCSHNGRRPLIQIRLLVLFVMQQAGKNCFVRPISSIISLNIFLAVVTLKS
jgi:hypothetical protein